MRTSPKNFQNDAFIQKIFSIFDNEVILKETISLFFTKLINIFEEQIKIENVYFHL